MCEATDQNTLVGIMIIILVMVSLIQMHLITKRNYYKAIAGQFLANNAITIVHDSTEPSLTETTICVRLKNTDCSFYRLNRKFFLLAPVIQMEVLKIRTGEKDFQVSLRE